MEKPASVQRFVARSKMPASADALYAWHAHPEAFARLCPPWQKLDILERSGGLDVGARTVIRVWLGPVPKKWVAVHTAHEHGRMFQDRQMSGPFAYWQHTHRFVPIDANTSELIDEVEYKLPLGVLGQLGGGLIAKQMLKKMFEHRHRVTAESLAAERK